MTGHRPAAVLTFDTTANNVELYPHALWLSELGPAIARSLAAKEFDSPPDITVLVVDDSMMQTLNQRYRQKSEPTDVLSFDLSEDTVSTLGEVYIGLGRAANQARDQGVSLEEELSRLMVHGMLHLAGYDHQNEKEAACMESVTVSYLTNLTCELPSSPRNRRSATTDG